MKVFTALFGLSLLLTACSNNTKQNSVNSNDISSVPQWSKEVVWYQIFVERFRNGDVNNDPKPSDLDGSYPGFVPDGWSITPWNQDWYKPDAWFSETGLSKFHENLQLRRYGGDLQGVIDKLDYLEELGITAIYFNPLNDSPSLHKYDPRHWRHIDRNFGPNPQNDIEIISNENPIDPATWQFTSADSLFLNVISECKKRGIRIVMDYSWNHTGMDFWALNDVRKNGKNSEFADWYHIEEFDNKNTTEDEFKYKGWYNIKYLPELKKDIVGQDTMFPFQGNLHSAQAKQHIYNVAKRWLDPNNDGDPSDGVDGYRLDVAAEIPLGFWPEFRSFVRGINPEAYLVGEIWWQEWPDKLMEPQQFLKGDIFDAIMNYRWYRNARWFFAEAPNKMKPSVFVDSLKRIQHGIEIDNQMAMMNLTASHDAPRTLTSLVNKNMYKHYAKPYDDSLYQVNKPNSATFKCLEMLLAHQFTYIGSPHIWYGDEVGMWGADDPDCRKPMVWNDITYEPELNHPYNVEKSLDTVTQNTVLLNYYKKLIEIRKNNKCLIYGDINFNIIDDNSEILAYSRTLNNATIIVLFNNSNASKNVTVESNIQGKYTNLLTQAEFNLNTGTELPGKSYYILKK